MGIAHAKWEWRDCLQIWLSFGLASNVHLEGFEQIS